MNKKNFLLLLTSASLAFIGCKKEQTNVINTPSNKSTITLDFKGLENLGSDYTYEGWLIVNGQAVSAGTFDVSSTGQMSQSAFELDQETIANASAYVLTIEPSNDPDPKPSDVHILGGDFNGSTATLTTAHKAAIGTDFTAAMGSYILATPTDGTSADENSGIWWLDPAAGPGPGLTLPTLPKGWAYEGWVVINGVPVSTGTFTSATGADNSSTYSGNVAGPAFPGEDFLWNPPSGLTFPVNLAGKTAVISVEPVPDNSTAPFSMKPLVGMISDSAKVHTSYNMNNNATASNPSGAVQR